MELFCWRLAFDALCSHLEIICVSALPESLACIDECTISTPSRISTIDRTDIHQGIAGACTRASAKQPFVKSKSMKATLLPHQRLSQ